MNAFECMECYSEKWEKLNTKIKQLMKVDNAINNLDIDDKYP